MTFTTETEMKKWFVLDGGDLEEFLTKEEATDYIQFEADDGANAEDFIVIEGVRHIIEAEEKELIVTIR